VPSDDDTVTGPNWSFASVHTAIPLGSVATAGALPLASAVTTATQSRIRTGRSRRMSTSMGDEKRDEA
jgi:hypothetical protein